jgi:hypothetical protein
MIRQIKLLPASRLFISALYRRRPVLPFGEKQQGEKFGDFSNDYA